MYRPQSRVKLFIPFLCYSLISAADSRTILPGVDVFIKGYTRLVEGQRVGLVTNQTGVNINGEATIDLLYHHPDVNLVSLFAPEHGIRGVLKAGEIVLETRDSKTGLPIHSLYGGNDKRPQKVALDTIDTLIYDIQDVGSRAYTYIWSMAEAMAAAGEYGKKFIIFDRPNPLSCRQIDGPVTEDSWQSFLGLYPIPRVYGLTVGELARYLNREHHLQCQLIVIPVAGYYRENTWYDTGLSWVPPSPNIPSPESAICFAATGTIGVLGDVHIGIGTQYPFQLIGAPWLNADHAAKHLNSCRLPGVVFQPFAFSPKKGLFRGENVQAVMLSVEKPGEFFPATTEVYILDYLQRYYKKNLTWKNDRINSFDKAMGTSKIRHHLENRRKASEIVREWRKDLSKFHQKIQPYLIYSSH